MGQFRAAVFGSTGLLGSQVVSALEKNSDCSEIIAVARKTSDQYESSQKIKLKVVDFNSLENFSEVFEVDAVFCCLGSTIKLAGSREKFETIDYEYPRKISRIAHMTGVRHFSLVSSVGADQNSPFFYLRTKAKAETALREIPFQSIRIFRPSLLLGNRQKLNQKKRPLESFAELTMAKLSFLFKGFLKRLKPVDVCLLADLMVHEAAQGEGGIKIIESEGINNFSQNLS